MLEVKKPVIEEVYLNQYEAYNKTAIVYKALGHWFLLL